MFLLIAPQATIFPRSKFPPFTIIFSISFWLLLPVLISQVGDGVKSFYLLLPVISYLALYIATVVMRQLGFLYYVNRSDLGWIRTDH